MTEEKKERGRLTGAVTRMIELTQQGKLEWRNASPSEAPEDEDRVTAAFVTTFNDRKLRLYGKRIEASQGEIMKLFVTAPQETKWRTIGVLEFINDFGMSLWRFPVSDATYDLLDAVQYRVAGVNEFLADIEALAS
jgi:hypothetical protein